MSFPEMLPDTPNMGSLNCISKHHYREFLELKGNFAYLLGSQKFRTSANTTLLVGLQTG